MSDLNLEMIRNLPEALERTPEGRRMMQLADRLGLWTNGVHMVRQETVPFVRDFPESPAELSKLYATWSSEAGRVIELVGLLTGQKERLQLQAKAARSRARARLRREAIAAAERAVADSGDDGLTRTKAAALKLPTSTQINDEAEEAPEVIEIEEAMSFIYMLLASAAAYKEAVLLYLNTISREMSYRQAQLHARVLA